VGQARGACAGMPGAIAQPSLQSRPPRPALLRRAWRAGQLGGRAVCGAPGVSVLPCTLPYTLLYTRRAQGGEGPLRIWGEDAIIAFPGAQTSIIDERDAYMARTIRAAAQGEPCPSCSVRPLR